MKNMRIERILALLLALLFVSIPAFAESNNSTAPILHPLVTVQDVPDTVQTEDRFVNLLVMGVDYGFDGYWGSASYSKKALEDCHTDAFIIVSINMTTSDINLISIPRDTVTYIPGIQGLYKLNAAFNCAETLEEAFENACNAASWLLGGIRIDYYACVDMGTMVALGDFIGGADVDVEMWYTGNSGKSYNKGLQHLDGQGLMDYARARKNATVNANDLGRTSRQRQVVEAIIKKLIENPKLVKSTWDYANNGELNFFTNLKLANVLNLANKINAADSIGSYVFTGKYKNACNWAFNFIDAATRKDVLQTVYGITVEDLPYVNYDSLIWLSDIGFSYVHTINYARSISAEAHALKDLTEEQKQQLTNLDEQIDLAATAFSEAAITLYSDREVTSALKEATSTLKAAGNTVYTYLHSDSKANWKMPSTYWYKDTLINEYLPVWG